MPQQDDEDIEIGWEEIGLIVVMIIAAILLTPMMKPAVEQLIWWLMINKPSEAHDFGSFLDQAGPATRTVAKFIVLPFTFAVCIVLCALATTLARTLLSK